MVERCVRDAEVAGSNPVAPIFYRIRKSKNRKALKTGEMLARKIKILESSFRKEIYEKKNFNTFYLLHYDNRLAAGCRFCGR